MYKIQGDLDSKEIIIAIPALGERKEMFFPLVEKMREYKWFLFDLPGSNKIVLEDYSIDSFCDYIQSILKLHNIDKAIFLGNSLGAWVIQDFANKFPLYIQSLILLDGGHYFLGEREKYKEVELLSSVKDFQDIKDAIRELTISMPNLKVEAYTNFERYFQDNYILQDDGYSHHFNDVAYNVLAKDLLSIDY